MDAQKCNVLTDLYHGKFIPEHLLFTNVPETPGNAELIALQHKIHDSVSPEIWRMIDESYSMISDLDMLSKERVFVCGYQTATKLFLAGLGQDVTDIAFAK